MILVGNKIETLSATYSEWRSISIEPSVTVIDTILVTLAGSLQTLLLFLTSVLMIGVQLHALFFSLDRVLSMRRRRECEIIIHTTAGIYDMQGIRQSG